MRPRKPLVFFIDRSLGKYDVPNALRGAGYPCELHDEHFRPETPDQEWLSELAGRSWVVLTKDEKIRYRPLELGAVRSAGLRVFIVICGNVSGEESARIILKAMPQIAATARRRRGAFVFYVYKNSSVRQAR